MAAVQRVEGLSAVSDVPVESEPLTPDEQQVLDHVLDTVGRERAGALPHEALIRFVRGYEFERKEHGMEGWKRVAADECQKTVTWREEINASTLLQRVADNALEKHDVFQRAWKSTLCGTDKFGHVLIVERLTDFDVDALMTFKTEDLTIHQAANLERLQAVKAQISERCGRTIYKHCYILDLSGLGMKHWKVKDHLKAIFHVAQYHYPETLFKMFLVSSPFAFRAAWKVVSPMVHPITKEKIKILGDKFHDELAANGIPRDQLPKSLGGSWDGHWDVTPVAPAMTKAAATASEAAPEEAPAPEAAAAAPEPEAPAPEPAAADPAPSVEDA